MNGHEDDFDDSSLDLYNSIAEYIIDTTATTTAQATMELQQLIRGHAVSWTTCKGLQRI